MTNNDKRNELIDLFAIAHMDRADPDEGYDYSYKFAKSVIQHYDTAELDSWIDDINNGFQVEYLPDFGDFEIV